MRKAAPHVAINKVVLGLKCDGTSWDVALRHSNILLLQWEQTHCSSADALLEPIRTRAERRLTDDERRIGRIITRHLKSLASSIDWVTERY